MSGRHDLRTPDEWAALHTRNMRRGFLIVAGSLLVWAALFYLIVKGLYDARFNV